MAPAPAPSPDGIDTLVSRISSFANSIVGPIIPEPSSTAAAPVASAPSVTATFINSASTTVFPSSAASTLATLPSSSIPATSTSSTSASAPPITISLNFFTATPTPTPTGLASNSNDSATMCDNTCIIAISTVLGGVFLILSILGIAYLILMKRRRRRLAGKDEDRALVAGSTGLAEKTTSSTPKTGPTLTAPPFQPRSAAGARESTIGQALSTDTGTPVDVTTMEGPPIGFGFVRRATDIANAVKEKLPGRGADKDKDKDRGRELGRTDRGVYQGLESRSQSRLDEHGRPSRGLGWAI